MGGWGPGVSSWQSSGTEMGIGMGGMGSGMSDWREVRGEMPNMRKWERGDMDSERYSVLFTGSMSNDLLNVK